MKTDIFDSYFLQTNAIIDWMFCQKIMKTKIKWLENF